MLCRGGGDGTSSVALAKEDGPGAGELFLFLEEFENDEADDHNDKNINGKVTHHSASIIGSHIKLFQCLVNFFYQFN